MRTKWLGVVIDPAQYAETYEVDAARTALNPVQRRRCKKTTGNFAPGALRLRRLFLCSVGAGVVATVQRASASRISCVERNVEAAAEHVSWGLQVKLAGLIRSRQCAVQIESLQ